MKYLFLDDERVPYLDPKYEYDTIGFTFVSAYHYSFFKPFKMESWVIVRTYVDFVKYIEKNGAEDLFVSFDHDLGKDINTGEELNGYDCVKWLCEYCQNKNIKFPGYYVHSWNSIGAKNIEIYIENYKKHVE